MFQCRLLGNLFLSFRVFEYVPADCEIYVAAWRIERFRTLIAERIVLDKRTDLFRKRDKRCSCNAQPNVASFDKRIAHREMVIVAIGFVFSILIDEVDVGSRCRFRTLGIYMAMVDGAMPAFVAHMYYRRKSEVGRCDGHVFQREIINAGESEYAISSAILSSE